jgi:hypothetical protein
LIALASLVPPGVDLPIELLKPRPIVWIEGEPGIQLATQEELTEAIRRLPEGTNALQHDLLLLMHQPEEWPIDYRLMAGPNASKKLLEITYRASQISAVRSRYGLVRNANNALREIASQNEHGRFLEIIVPTQLMIRRDDRTGKSKALYDPIYSALIGEKLDYLRTCPRCDQLFFAARINSSACPKCRDAHRKKKQRNRKRN